jgi:hypothetical protein
VLSPGLSGDGSGLAGRSLAWTAREGGGALREPDAAAPHGRRGDAAAEGAWEALSPPVTLEGERPEEAAPAPPRLDVLAVLAPGALPALGAGMQQFLEQLERMGQRLGEDRAENGLWPWLVAGAAAAVACEIARRQLGRPPTVPALAGLRMPGVPAGAPFTG